MDAITFIFNEENVRTVIMLMAVAYGVLWLKLNLEKTIDEKLEKMEKKITGVIDDRINLLKTNDFAHLNRTIKALTFTLEKNNVLNPEDKKYIDSHLDEK